MDTSLELKIKVWERLNTEVLQYMKMLDFWIMFLLGLVIFLIVMSRQPGYRDFIVWAALAAAITPVWIGRIDVLIHRPVPATIDVEEEISADLQRLESLGTMVRRIRDDRPEFASWENYYKPKLKTGVKVLVPLDALALVFLLALFVHANNEAAKYLVTQGSSWANAIWCGCWASFLFGVGIILFAKKLAE